jgi:Asp-tRNA(Asn)/Glu-tRNA(Gln) amidotransferase B subunit
MNTHITITEHGPMYTVDIHSTAMGSAITATLSGPAIYSMVDGLLWWTINSKLSSLVATAMDETPTERAQRMQYGASLEDGRMLVHHVYTTPFYQSTEEQQARIVETIGKHLPELAPLTRYGTHAELAKAELAELMELCTLLQDRILHSAIAMHGIQAITTTTKAAA